MGRIYLFLMLFLLWGCAEVAPLTGGDKDEIAPRTVANSQNPAQGSTNFNGKELTVTFDEYIVLNDPTNTVTMNPQAGKTTVTTNKKQLTIAWSETLQPNTTYIIQLNGTVQDLNEKNDTIHQFVFSTGAQIDTLKHGGRVLDAATNKPLDNYTVGLYPVNSNPFKDSYTYAVRSDKLGNYKFNYLNAAEYVLFAFQDANKDRVYTPGEAYAFASKDISTTDTTLVDIRAFKPKNVLNKLQIQLELPGLARCFGRDLNSDSLYLNNAKVEILKRFSTDSVLVSLPAFNSSFLTFTYANDTVSKPITLLERSKNFKPLCTNYKNALLPDDTIRFTCPELFVVDPNKIAITAGADTLSFEYETKANEVFIFPKLKNSEKIHVKLMSGAFTGLQNQSDSVNLLLEPKKAADLCNLIVACSDLTGANWHIQLMDGKRSIAELVKNESDTTVTFQGILPASYQLVCFQDNNQNGHWDVGSYPEKKQPEPIWRFVIQAKLRPNWDILEKLEFH